MKYRVKFSKNGAIKYIGHLDVMRYFQKAIRRAHIPIAYTEGFSPHQILSFAFPLSVGFTSEGEYFDMELTEETDENVIFESLNSQLNEGIQIIAVKKLPDKSPNCMSSVFAASYEVTIKDKVSLPDDFQNRAVDFYSQQTIPVNKPKKKGGGYIFIDLKEYLYDFNAISNNSIGFTVNASSDSNIKPTFVTECLLNYMGAEIPENAFDVKRIDIFENTGTAEDIKLQPLINC